MTKREELVRKLLAASLEAEGLADVTNVVLHDGRLRHKLALPLAANYAQPPQDVLHGLETDMAHELSEFVENMLVGCPMTDAELEAVLAAVQLPAFQKYLSMRRDLAPALKAIAIKHLFRLSLAEIRLNVAEVGSDAPQL